MAFAPAASGLAFDPDRVPNWPEDADLEMEIHPGPARDTRGDVSAPALRRVAAPRDA